MIDIHSHILMGMDDGAKSIEESLSMVAIAAEEGIKQIVATPHCIDEEDLEGFAFRVREKCRCLQEELDKEGIGVDIIPGAEVYMDPMILGRTGLDDLALGDTNYILVELPMGEVPGYAEDFLFQLQLRRLIPIIAHPERNRQIIEKPNILAKLIELGSLVQINTGSISGFFGPMVQKNARILLTHNMGHVLGSDAHSDRRRGPYMRQAGELLYGWLGKDRAEEIIYHNPRTILKGEVLTVEPPIEYRPRKNIFQFLKKRKG